MTETLTSLKNPRIKNVFDLLEKPSARREQNRIVIEGIRETKLAIAAGLEADTIFVCSDLFPLKNLREILPEDTAKVQIFEITRDIYSKLAYRGYSEGIITVASPRFLTLDEIPLRNNPLIVVLETVEKPGNLGAILRTADAAAIDAVIICDPQTDIYNPNVIRSSIGCIFTNRVVTCTSENAIGFLNTKGIKIFAAALPGKKMYHETLLTGPAAIVFGSEALGLTATWLKSADEIVQIPMLGKIDSLNVSNSAAILVYEALRQRNFVK